MNKTALLKLAAEALKWVQDVKPDTLPRYTWNDIGNGYLFADFAKRLTRYVPERGIWYFYNGTVWEPDAKGLKTMELCKVLADQLRIYSTGKAEYQKHIDKWQTRRYRETILKDAASVHPIYISEFDQNSALFNCKNGTLDLETLAFRDHDPEDLLTVVSGVKYTPGARCTRWEQFIAEVTQGSAEKAVFLQKALGYGLTGETDEECFFILYGATTRNGKGTLMETYMKLQGGYGRAARPETIAQKDKVNGSAPSEDVAQLAGARVVNISEPDKQLVLSSSLIKTLTGRDTVRARFLHENSFEFMPQFKLFINTNHLPKVTDPTVFSSGRVKVIPFERHFAEAEQDKGLKQKLRRVQSLSGIFNWCLEGLRLYRAQGLNVPAEIAEATAQYQRDSDKIARFVEEMLEPDYMGEIRTEDAYRAYQSWCQRNGQYAEAMPSWKQSMEAYAPIKRKRPNGAGKEAIPQTLILGFKWRGVQGCAAV